MANEDLVTIVLEMTKSYFEYMLPLIGVMIGIVFVVSLFNYYTIGVIRKMFKD